MIARLSNMLCLWVSLFYKGGGDQGVAVWEGLGAGASELWSQDAAPSQFPRILHHPGPLHRALAPEVSLGFHSVGRTN